MSDIISIHCPLNASTKNLINLTNIRMMKPSALLINMARGGIVNEPDIVSALNQNIIAGFGTDVFEKEPMDLKSPFFSLKNTENVVLTPHIAWTSIEARTLLIDKLIHNLVSFLDQFKHKDTRSQSV